MANKDFRWALRAHTTNTGTYNSQAYTLVHTCEAAAVTSAGTEGQSLMSDCCVKIGVESAYTSIVLLSCTVSS